jgi:uncharacterized protein YecE (DUF72 family)
MRFARSITMENVRIGCSGFYYPEWKGKFYPDKLPRAQWLAHYSTIFNTVELNGTFYRKPKAADLARYARITPADFTFAVKASRYITHVMKLKDAAPVVREFTELIGEGLGNKFGKLLFQLPPTFHFSPENLDRVSETIAGGELNVVEFRHASWWNEEVITRLKTNSVIFCNVDFPGLDVPFVSTSDRFYLRMHGTPELFRSPYGKERLETFYRRIPAGCKSYNIYFNNTASNAAYDDAQLLMGLFKTQQ